MAYAARPPIKRSELPPGEVLCSYCTAKCCRYYALPVETPESFSDWEYVRWYVLHEYTSVFKEGETWYLLVHTPCQHLLPDNRCGIYETRPPICREYTTESCEYDDDSTYEQYLETPEQVAEYVEAILPRRERESFRTPRPPLLAILA